MREALGCLNSLLLLIKNSKHDFNVYQKEIRNRSKVIKEGVMGRFGRNIGNGKII